MIATAFFLGMKSAQVDINLGVMKNIFVFLKDFNKDLQISNEELLLKYEFYMIHILNYDFYVFCPYKAMMGFMYKIQTSDKFLAQFKNFDNFNFKEIEIEAEKLIDRIFATDAMFIYNYSFIAISCTILAFQIFNQSKNLGINTFEILEILEIINIIDVNNFINNILSKIEDMIIKIPNFSREEIREKKSRTSGFLSKYKEYNEKLEADRM